MVLPSHPESSTSAKNSTPTPPQNLIISALTLIVFAFFDFLDGLFGIILSYLDGVLERDGPSSSSPCSGSSCYRRRDEHGDIDGGAGKGRLEERGKINYGNEKSRGEEEDDERLLSETLYCRRNYFRHHSGGALKRLKLNGRGEGELVWRTGKEGGFGIRSGRRWSDCGCERCVSWMNKDDSLDGSGLKLHVVVQGPCPTGLWNSIENATTNPHMDHVVFLHGFLSSSSFWTQTVFPNLSSSANRKFRSFAVDLLGFGSSPKPNDCLYTLKDHVKMIEKSVIEPYRRRQLDNNNGSFGYHLVAHSMGCIIALAVAAKDPNSVRSLTLIAPPYVPSGDGVDASTLALHMLAGKRLWPPLLFGASFMSWYEHLGRVVCFLFCRNHRMWEFILKILTLKRDLPFMVLDLTRHTHHSAWHTMHNVICGGAKLTDKYLEILKQSKVKVTVIQGDRDQIVPLECGYYIKTKLPEADVKIVPNADHSNVILSRPKEFTRDLECIWDAARRP